MDYEGTFGIHTIRGHRKGDDVEVAARGPNNQYFHAIDTDGAPARRPEPMNTEPTFCYLYGSDYYTQLEGIPGTRRRRRVWRASIL
jgi:hypothetical protein